MDLALSRSARRGVVVLLSLCWLVGTPTLAQSDISGQTATGAHYRIVVPAGWLPADGLVIWNHGFDLGPIGPVTDLGPLATVHQAQGFAVAASSYSLTGWAVFQTLDDNRQMVDEFEAMFGVPDEVYVYGASLGGIVTAQAIEGGGLGNIVGALPICGALAGSRSWDAAVDLRLAYDVVCGGVAGAAIPGGAGGLPAIPDPGFDEVAMALAVNACTGVSLPEGLRTAAQQSRLDQLLALSTIPEDFLLTDMGFVTFGLHDLVYDPAKLDGAQAMDNSTVVYPDPAVDAAIERVQADTVARGFLRDHTTPTGDVGATKIVSLHTDQDGLVIVENQSEYQAVVPAANLTVGIVVEDTPSHCGFNDAEVLAAWELLRAWVDGGPQPTASDLQTTCETLDLDGTAPGPCRIDPGFALGDWDSRVPTRGELFGDGFESGTLAAWTASLP